MVTYIILSRIGAEAFADPAQFKQLADRVSSEIKKQCPGVVWKESFSTLGRFDVIDIIDAPDPKQAEKAAMIIRAYGHAVTETLPATPWKEFVDSLWHLA